MTYFRSLTGCFSAICIGLIPASAMSQDRQDRIGAFNQCILGALPKFDDGKASPESIFLAARFDCNAEEDALTQKLTDEFESKFSGADPKLKTEYVFGLRDAVMQKTLRGVAAFILSQRVAERGKTP